MPLFTSPTSYRLANMLDVMPRDLSAASPFVVFSRQQLRASHPSLGHLVLLVFEAVMEVVCVSLPGYIVARLGHFDADKQKFLANLNVMLFTPCLIFTKLASQLNADKLVELAVIPVIFVIQTLVSFLAARLVSRLFGLNKRASNFVTAMGVFGNSNSLPISLVLSLSQTLQGLHWSKIPGDNDDEVAARGILYLLIFQQLGQLVRWSWGYHVLLAPKDKYDAYAHETIEEGRYRDDSETEAVAEATDSDRGGDDDDDDDDDDDESRSGAVAAYREHSPLSDSSVYEPAGRTPVLGHSRASLADTADADDEDDGDRSSPRKYGSTRKHPGGIDAVDGGYPYDSLPGAGAGIDGMLSFPRIRNSDERELPGGIRGLGARARIHTRRFLSRAGKQLARSGREAFAALPGPVRLVLEALGRGARRAYAFLWEFMNPPLWAMLIAVLVASVPSLQRLFFQEGSFIKNSVTSAVTSSAGVAVPLILVVLGANLARNTQSSGGAAAAAAVDPEERQMGTKLLVASLVSRMVLPTVVIAPVLALFAKYVPVSILDDPIFVVVCFLLTGAPSALQLAQICQINGVYEDVMSRILFHSYVVWMLPSTLILVMCALEVVEWAAK